MYFEREKVSRGGAERRRERESQAGSELSMHCEADTGLDPMNHEMVTWAKSKSQMLNWLNHPGIPGNVILKPKQGKQEL